MTSPRAGEACLPPARGFSRTPGNMLMHALSRTCSAIAFVVGPLFTNPVRAQEPAAQPRPVPLTRPEMKEALEALKKIKPRIPLPELTDAEKEKLGERGG